LGLLPIYEPPDIVRIYSADGKIVTAMQADLEPPNRGAVQLGNFINSH
jgi:hypothetical protein